MTEIEQEFNSDSEVELEDDLDPLPSQNQKWALVSFISPKNTDFIGNKTITEDFYSFKIRGVFKSTEQAESFVKKLRTKDKDHDIFLTKTGRWVPWSSENIEKVKYEDERLNAILKEFRNQTKSTNKKFQKDLEERCEEAKKKGSKEGQAYLESIEYKKETIGRLLEEVRRLEEEITLQSQQQPESCPIIQEVE